MEIYKLIIFTLILNIVTSIAVTMSDANTPWETFFTSNAYESKVNALLQFKEYEQADKVGAEGPTQQDTLGGISSTWLTLKAGFGVILLIVFGGTISLGILFYNSIAIGQDTIISLLAVGGMLFMIGLQGITFVKIFNVFKNKDTT